ncbi:hypothetical protein ABB37_08036 [Leptomonas pyrrhocoris]|uniref:Uncharacterized protein n=1 Tax=Leptomonas pyrrhocoris TaxID=157538 RepID=A0A0N0VDR4_LEPPY|nr:hypothetical protein ABB37_08036 [Leptomonas pyrrhocoris]KPA76321.1 hypothetical protein ABB37_08036 [Leptomonas pyrrhocoris]|eukprot:XP_015654760.1 hypothetical protein ABB37_08036 [Leptomonas pyrrhocoris]
MLHRSGCHSFFQLLRTGPKVEYSRTTTQRLVQRSFSKVPFFCAYQLCRADEECARPSTPCAAIVFYCNWLLASYTSAPCVVCIYHVLCSFCLRAFRVKLQLLSQRCVLKAPLHGPCQLTEGIRIVSSDRRGFLF